MSKWSCFFGGGALPGGLAAAHHLHHVVYRIKIGIAQIGHLGFDIARHGQIEQENGAVAAFAQGAFHHAFADNRQLAGGGRHNHVVLMQPLRQFAQRAGGGGRGQFVAQFLSTLGGTVGHGDAARRFGGEMGGHQFNHLARAHE